MTLRLIELRQFHSATTRGLSRDADQRNINWSLDRALA